MHCQPFMQARKQARLLGDTDAHPCQKGSEAPFEALELNIGAYQNLPHLHLKAWVSAAAHEAQWQLNETYRTLRAFSYHLGPLEQRR